MQTNYEKISYLVNQEIKNFPKIFQNKIIKSLTILLGNRIKLYNFLIDETNDKKISKSDFLEIISLISEYNLGKEKKGAYYTNKDVCDYIIWQSINLKYGKDKEFDKNYNNDFKINKLTKIDELLFESSFFDPTCGSGHFLISIFGTKYEILKTHKKEISDSDIINISKTIFGNDYDPVATDICKIRLFFFILEKIKNQDSITEIASIIKDNLFCFDYIGEPNTITKKFDFLVGNPPYVEYPKYEGILTKDYGNVYADILDNACNHLKASGILGFIIPISYISTPRMFKIREKIEEFSEKEYILSFADRPDCLFKGVHQKLNILIAQEGKQKCEVFTSNYNYRYKGERNSLFPRITITKNTINFKGFLAKYGNNVENNILKKIVSFGNGNDIYSIQDKNGIDLYLSMRAAFWIKAFSFNPGSNEYKCFKYNESVYYFILCLLNSSLFWFYRVGVSDCWHITQKELKGIKIPFEKVNNEGFKTLYKNLEKELEKTKEYVGTKQTEYEYKHKKCKEYIDKIDDKIGEIYGLNNEEINYIKSFALNYR